MQLRRFHLILALAATSLAGGCTRWEVSGASTAPTVIASHHRKARIQRTDGSIVSLSSTFYQRDSVIGISSGHWLGVASVEISHIAIRTFDGSTTAAVIVGGFVGLSAVLFLLISSSYGSCC